MSIKRWKFGLSRCSCVKCESAMTIEQTEDNCGWVRWGDHESEINNLKAEIERLKYIDVIASVSSGKSIVYYLAEISKLKSEVERLRKAGDEMYSTIKVSDHFLDSAIAKWKHVTQFENHE